MIAPALQHRIYTLAHQVGPQDDLPGAPAHLHRFSTRAPERLAGHTVPDPTLEWVLEGKKKVERGDDLEIVHGGQLLLVPANLPLDVRHEPCPESGRYRSMRLAFAPQTLARFADRWPDATPWLPGTASLRVDLTPELAESLGHVLEALLAPELHGRLLAEHRLMELLLRLHYQRRLPV